MTDYSRRSLLKNVPITVAGAGIIAAAGPMLAKAQARPPIPGAFKADFDLKPLNFNPAQLDGLSEQLIMSHWENNYGGSVRALNIIKQRIQAALANDDIPAFVYNDLKREHLMRMGSVILHEYYFDNLSPPVSRDTELDRVLARAFGSVSNWEREFRRIGAGLGGGSGWVVMAWNLHTRTLENYWMADHMHNPTASMPLLVMDMYEHSYHMDYGASAGQYINAFMNNINWGVVAERFNIAMTTRT